VISLFDGSLVGQNDGRPGRGFSRVFGKRKWEAAATTASVVDRLAAHRAARTRSLLTVGDAQGLTNW
jgi:hypothetical protein